MALPSTQRKWVIMGREKGLDDLQLVEGPIPKVDDYGVLVKLHAASINPREVQIMNKVFAISFKLPVVGGSDGAGEVVEVGSRVTKFKKGDRVATLFNPGHQSGPMTAAAYRKGGLGGTLDGTFQQYGAFEETGLVRLAEHLSYLEGASLSDAAVTAWNALYGGKPIKPGDWVLIQGTGGVSLFAIQFAKMGGAKIVATTSSPAKLDLLRSLGADHVINYRENPDWGTAARKFTPNEDGFDGILEVGGSDTLSQSLRAIKFEGVISVIGVLTGVDSHDSILEALIKICTFRGLHVGSRQHMEDMMAAIDAHKLRPLLNERVFVFEEMREAIEYRESQKGVGKVVVKIA